MKWWLISNENVVEIREALEYAIREKEDECISAGHLCGLDGSDCAGWLKSALHSLDSGRHETNAVPKDHANQRESI